MLPDGVWHGTVVVELFHFLTRRKLVGEVPARVSRPERAGVSQAGQHARRADAGVAGLNLALRQVYSRWAASMPDVQPG